MWLVITGLYIERRDDRFVPRETGIEYATRACVYKRRPRTGRKQAFTSIRPDLESVQMVSSDTRSVSELERRVEAFDATGPGEMDADDRARLTDALVALADAYGDRGEFDAEAEMIARLDRLYQAGEDGDADIHLANALANAASVRGREAVYQTAIDPDRLEEYRERIESLYGRRTEPAIAAPLARATAETIHANGKSDRRGRITPLLERIEEVYAAHPEPDIAASVLRAHAHAELYLDDEPERDDTADGSPTERDDAADGSQTERDDAADGSQTERDDAADGSQTERDDAADGSQTERDDAADGSQTERDDAADGSQTERDAGRDRVVRAEELFGDHPDGEVAAGLAGVLAGRTNADAKRTDVAAIEERIARIEALADQYPGQAESVRRWLPVATANATRASFEAADPGRVEHWASVTVDHHERLSTPSSATWAAVATFFAARASFFDGDVEAGETELERLEALERQYDSPVFAHWLGRAMFDAARSLRGDGPPRTGKGDGRRALRVRGRSRGSRGDRGRAGSTPHARAGPVRRGRACGRCRHRRASR